MLNIVQIFKDKMTFSPCSSRKWEIAVRITWQFGLIFKSLRFKFLKIKKKALGRVNFILNDVRIKLFFWWSGQISGWNDLLDTWWSGQISEWNDLLDTWWFGQISELCLQWTEGNHWIISQKVGFSQLSFLLKIVFSQLSRFFWLLTKVSSVNTTVYYAL